MATFIIRPLDSQNAAEVRLVAARMRLTLMEVVGKERGTQMYEMEWLIARVRWHLDASTGAVFVAECAGIVVGHTITREDAAEDGTVMGLFSTTYVAQEARRSGIADALLVEGELWMREHGLGCAATHTAATNTPLIRLYEKHGYTIVLQLEEDTMVRLSKSLMQ